MADVTEVMTALSLQVEKIVYPNGKSNPSITGNDVRIYPGWPLPASLDADLPQGISHVSIFTGGSVRNTTRFQPKQKVMSIVTPTLTLSVSGSNVTVGGAMPSPFSAHNLALLVNNAPYIYAVQSGDTMTSIATAIAALLNAQFPGTSSSGPVITLPAGLTPIVARVGTAGTVTTEWERNEEMFRISVWTSDFNVRATIGAAIRSAFAQIHDMTMVDGYGANILFKDSRLIDEVQKERIYRRDLLYQVEYATTSTQQVATVVAVKATFEDDDGNPITTRTY